jgi:hypothetical protein
MDETFDGDQTLSTYKHMIEILYALVLLLNHVDPAVSEMTAPGTSVNGTLTE